jgi:hypothetical protein
MKTLAITAALIAAIAVPSMLLAADNGTTTNALVCRAAGATDTPNATMGSTGLVCRKIDMPKMQAAISKVRAVLDQMDPAYRAEVQQLLDMETQAMYGG